MSQSGLSGAKSRKSLDILGFVHKYALVILVIGTCCFLVLAPFAFLFGKPFFEAKARIRIVPVLPSIITKKEELSIVNYYHDYVRTQVQRLKENHILKDAVNELTPPEKAALFGKMPLQRCVDVLDKILLVRQIPNSHLIELSITGAKPEGLAPILNNVIDKYLKILIQEEKDKDEGSKKYVSEERDELQKKIREKEEKLQDLGSNSSTSTFVEEFNIKRKKLEQILKDYTEVRNKKIQLENFYFQKQLEIQELKNIPLDAYVDELVTKDQSLDFISSWTYQKLQEMRATIDGVTMENPDRKYIEDRMVAMRDYEKDLNKEVRDLAEKVIYGKRNYDFQTALVKAENAYKAELKNEASLQNELEIAQKEASHNSIKMLEGQWLQAELTNLRNLLFRLDTRIHELELESNASPRVFKEVMATPPDSPSGTQAKKLLILFFLISYGPITVALFALDFFDNRIKRRKDVEYALGSPPSWPIFKAAPGVNFSRVTIDDMDSRPAKAIRRLVVRLHEEWKERGARVFLFSGVELENGTTEIMLNASYVMAKILPKVIVIEGGYLRNSLKELVHAPHDHPELKHYLLEKRRKEPQTPPAIRDYIFRDEERDIDVLFSVGLSLNQGDFLELLAELLKDYDAVFIDSDPVLESDFTEFLAKVSHVVSLVIQGNKSLFKDVQSSASHFVRLGAPAICPVLNWGAPEKPAWIELQLSKSPWKYLQISSYTQGGFSMPEYLRRMHKRFFSKKERG